MKTKITRHPTHKEETKMCSLSNNKSNLSDHTISKNEQKTNKPLPYQSIKIGTDVFIEEKDNPEILKANVRDIYDFGIAFQTEEYDGVVYIKKDFGYTFKIWEQIPTKEEQENDPWRNQYD